MQKVKKFFENHKTVRIICAVLAVAMAIGALGVFTSVLQGGSGTSGGGGSTSPGKRPSGELNVTEDYGRRSADYAALYEQNGLVACYVTYGMDGMQDNGDGTLTWENQVADGNNATLYGSQYWKRMNGGMGYTMNLEQWIQDKNNVGVTIPYDLYLRDETKALTVESVFSYGYVTDNYGEIVMLTEEDSLIDSYRFLVNNFEKSTFRFGLLSSSVSVANTFCSPSSVGCTNWQLTNRKPTFLQDSNLEGVYQIIGGGLPGINEYGHRNLDKITLMSVSMAYPNDSAFVFSGIISQGRFNDRSSFSFFRNDADYQALMSVSYTDEADRFSLMNGMPGTMYAVRYYNTEISEETRDRNFFVDLCGFYGLNVSSFFSLAAEELDAVLVECGKQAKAAGLEMDCANIASNRIMVNEIIKANVK